MLNIKEYVIKFSDNERYDYRRQEVWSDNRDEKVSFSVYDMSECPEDAIIGRDLFDAHDFIKAVKLGFKIAKRGYDKIRVEEEPWEE